MIRVLTIDNSVVFRGIPSDNFRKSVDSIRTWHDGEIILSTWDHIDVEEELVDEVVKTKDPGPMKDFLSPSLRHAKRQILAARNGVLASKGKRILLTRADMVHNISLFDFLKERDSSKSLKNKVFSRKLVVGNMMTINPDVPFGPPRNRFFRVCDWFQCGYREDIMKFTDIIEEVKDSRNSGCCLEQLWFISCLNKFSDLNFDPRKLESYSNEAWETMLTNFLVLDTRTTAKSDNLNWLFQNEYLSCYMTEKQYNLKAKHMNL